MLVPFETVMVPNPASSLPGIHVGADCDEFDFRDLSAQLFRFQARGENGRHERSKFNCSESPSDEKMPTGISNISVHVVSLIIC
jgi:hypothetical protein